MNIDLSIVIPCYYAEKNIASVVEEIEKTFKTTEWSYEIVLVNDGSKDNTFKTLQKLAHSKQNIIAIDLAKNSGQHAAIMAGFHYAHGNMIATCEDDGQTQIEVLPEMIKKMEEGYDVVVPHYTSRVQPSFVRRSGTKLAVWMSKTLINRPKEGGVPIYFVAKRFVIEEVIRYTQPYPYIEGLILRTTHNIGRVSAVQKARVSGQSGYTLKKLLSLWLNGFTAFSIKPLRVSILLGVISAVCGIVVAIVIVARKLLGYGVLAGWSSTIALILFMFGIVLMVLGMIGEYLGRIYMCINQTPQFVVKQVTTREDL